MARALILLPLVTCLASFGQIASTRPTDNEVARVALVRGRDLLYVKVSIDGKTSPLLKVDTASSFSVISDDLAKELNLNHLGKRRINTFEGDQELSLVGPATLSIGSLTMKNMSLLTRPEYNTEKQLSYDGVLGMDVLGTMPIKLDFRGCALTFYRDIPQTTAPIPLHNGWDQPVIRGKIEDVSGWFAVDTGFPSTVMLSSNFISLNPELAAHKPKYNEIGKWDQPADDFLTRWTSYEFLGKVADNRYGFYQAKPGITGVAGLIGCSIVRDYCLTIDMRSHRMWAERYEKESLENLLKRLGDPRGTDLEGLTPLHHAAFESRPDAIKALLERGADPNAQDNAGVTALMAAAGRGDNGSTALLLTHGARTELRVKGNGATAVTIASQYGRTNTLRTLIDAKVDINAVNAAGRTTLFIAADTDQVEVCKLLLESGAAVDSETPEGETPLMAACRNGSLRCVTLLLQSRANSNAVANSGTPLFYAARSPSPECVRLLLKNGADPNLRAKNGFTPLVAAAASMSGTECVEALLSSGADPNLPVGSKTPLEYARLHGSPKSIRLLSTLDQPKSRE